MNSNNADITTPSMEEANNTQEGTTPELVLSSPPREPSFFRPLGTPSTPDSTWVYTNTTHTGSTSMSSPPRPLPIPVPSPIPFTAKDPEMEYMTVDLEEKEKEKEKEKMAGSNKGFFAGGFLKRLPRAMVRKTDNTSPEKNGPGYGNGRKLPSTPLRFRRATVDTATSASTLPRYEAEQAASNVTAEPRPAQYSMPVPTIAEPLSETNTENIPDQLLTAPALNQRHSHHSSDHHSSLGQQLSVHNVALHDSDDLSSFVHVPQRISYLSRQDTNISHAEQAVDLVPAPNIVASPQDVTINILPTSDYAAMPVSPPASPSRVASPIPQHKTQNQVQRFFHNIHTMPWISSERITSDFRPGATTRLANGEMVRVEKPLKSWYTETKPTHAVDLFSEGMSSPTTATSMSRSNNDYVPTIRAPRRPHHRTRESSITSAEGHPRPHHHRRAASTPDVLNIINHRTSAAVSKITIPTPTTPRRHTRRESSQASPPISPVYAHPGQPMMYAPPPLYIIPSPPPTHFQPAFVAQHSEGNQPPEGSQKYVVGAPSPYPYQYYTPPYAISSPPPVHISLSSKQAAGSAA